MVVYLAGEKQKHEKDSKPPKRKSTPPGKLIGATPRESLKVTLGRVADPILEVIDEETERVNKELEDTRRALDDAKRAYDRARGASEEEREAALKAAEAYVGTEKEVGELRKDVETARGKVVEFTETVESQNKNIEEAEEKLAAAEKKLEEAEARMEGRMLGTYFKVAEMAYDSEEARKRDKKEADGRMSRIEERLDDADRKYRELDQTYKGVRSRVETVEGQVGEITQELADAANDSGIAMDAAKQAQKIAEQHDSDVDELRQQVHRLSQAPSAPKDESLMETPAEAGTPPKAVKIPETKEPGKFEKPVEFEVEEEQVPAKAETPVAVISASRKEDEAEDEEETREILTEDTKDKSVPVGQPKLRVVKPVGESKKKEYPDATMERAEEQAEKLDENREKLDEIKATVEQLIEMLGSKEKITTPKMSHKERQEVGVLSRNSSDLIQKVGENLEAAYTQAAMVRGLATAVGAIAIRKKLHREKMEMQNKISSAKMPLREYETNTLTNFDAAKWGKDKKYKREIAAKIQAYTEALKVCNSECADAMAEVLGKVIERMGEE